MQFELIQLVLGVQATWIGAHETCFEDHIMCIGAHATSHWRRHATSNNIFY